MRGLGVLILLLAVLLVAPAGADATTVTFGADLTQNVTVGPACGSSTGQACSFVTTINPDGFGDRGSPIDGVLTSARVKTVGGATTVDVRVLRPDPVLISNYLNVGPETPIPVPDVSPSSTGVISEATGLHHPMNQHDRLGIGWNQPSTPLNFGAVSGSSSCAFRQQPTYSDGGHPVDTTVQYDNAGCLFQVLVQGTVETDADHDGYGDDTQDQCPTDASTHGPCPTTGPPPPPHKKKKCKKKKHHRTAEVAKKKCKKHP
jgi:hypothetical protein